MAVRVPQTLFFINTKLGAADFSRLLHSCINKCLSQKDACLQLHYDVWTSHAMQTTVYTHWKASQASAATQL